MTSEIDALAPLPAPPGANPQQVADAITTQARSSFAAGMRLLPRPRREAMRSVYALARILDDIADGDWPGNEKRRLLDAWRGEVDRLYEGKPRSAIGQALAGPVTRYRLPRVEFLLLIEGMEMDAGGPVIAPSMVRLRAYTRRVAGSVGMLSMRIFGAWRGDESERAALALGDALQLTNILRDVEDDAAIGRLYLPREVLEAAGIAPEIIAGGPVKVAQHPECWRARAELGRLARAEFVAARRAMATHGRLQLAPALMMTGVYEGYLARMEADGFRAGQPVALSQAAKLWCGLRRLIGPLAPRRDKLGGNG